MRRLSDLGERELIRRIARASGPGEGSDVILGIGDDAAILRTRPKEDFVTSTDALVENVHFRWSTQTPQYIGRRALIANLSDLAAMGARPIGFVLALSAPPDLSLSRFDGLFAGLLREARSFDCPLIGGNLARSNQTVLSITIFGAVSKGNALRRDQLRAGDALYVTGTLGGAALALARSEQLGTSLRRLPVPRIGAARALSLLKGRGACIDISDGLVPDLQHILSASGVGADLWSERVPTTSGFSAACRRLQLDPNRLSLAGGEDYELLFSLRRSASKRNSLRELSDRLGIAVTQVGQVTRETGLRGVVSLEGFRHY